jgi:hypothetical protein
VYSFDDSINVLCPEGGGVTRVRMAGAETNVSDPAGPIVNLGRASGTEFGVAKLGSGDGMEGSMEQATIGGKNIPVQANELGNMFVNIVEPYVPQDCSGKWHDVSPSFHHWECAQFGNVVTASFYIKNIAGGWEPGKNIHLGTSDHSIFRGLGGNTRPYKYCSYNLTGDQENPGLYAKCHQINGHAFIVMGELVSNLFFVHFDYDWEENAGKCDMVITCDYVLNP